MATQNRIPSRPVYSVRLLPTTLEYNLLTPPLGRTRIASCKSSFQLSYHCCVQLEKSCSVLNPVLKPYDSLGKIVQLLLSLVPHVANRELWCLELKPVARKSCPVLHGSTCSIDFPPNTVPCFRSMLRESTFCTTTCILNF